MKRLLLIITSLFLISQTMAQGPVEVDVWKKSKNKNRLKNIFKSSDIPNTFASTLPNGESVIYEKWDRPDVKIETSSGRKITYKPNVYRTKSKKIQSVISYDGKKWDGVAKSDGNEYYNISSDIVKKDTIKPQKMIDGDHDDYLIAPNSNDDKKLKKFGQTLDANTPVADQTLSSIDLYNPLIRINKTATVYVEVENSLHTSWGNNLSTSISRVTIIMNNVSDIYDREGINVVNNHIYVWETQDPYSSLTTSFDKLNRFTTNLTARTPTTTTSHFKHLLSGASFIGGIAWVNGGGSDGYQIVGPNLRPDFTVAVSGIGGYNVVNSSTTYSWPVYVVTHEMGHNLGSRHTQYCGWKNDQGVSIGRLDSCYEGENGSCGTTTKPNYNGTIMSYCHINGSINPNLGFGKYPRFQIRGNLYFSTEIPFDNVVIPTVTTNSITLITPTSARSGGVVTNDGGGPTIGSGVCWSTSQNPTISLTTKTSDGTSNIFTSNITGLLPSTIYYVRSYATNSAGTGYGQQVQFTTSASTEPIVSTSSPTLIGGTIINIGGNVTNSGGQTVTSRGVCWSTSPNPTISLSTKTSDGTGTGSFTSSITGLSVSTTYYIRAYATNSIGTSYGSQIISTTTSSLLPSVVTNTSVLNYTNYNGSSFGSTLLADCGGNVLNTGGTSVTARGLCWSTTSNPPTIANSKTSNGTGVGAFNSRLSGLLKGTLYYMRAYATNSSGTSYGDVVTFTTPNTPTLVLSSITNINSTGAQFTGTLTTRGVDAVGYLFYVGTTPGGPYTNFVGFMNSVPTYPSGTYTGTLSNQLSPNTTYYAVMFASTLIGDVFSSEVSFTTAGPTLPTVTTGALTVGGITNAPTFTSNCNVTNSGGSTVTERGICISTNQNPTTSNTKVVSITSGTGSYTVTTLPLLPNVTYYARAYAINSSGTAYGSQVSGIFSATILTTLAATNITSTSATLGGSAVLAQNATLLDCGILLATSGTASNVNYQKFCSATLSNPWSCTITGLSPSTTYSYVCYINGTNIIGNPLTFTTSGSTGFPTVTTTTISAIGSTTATGGGNVTSIGGSAVTAKGICWSTTSNPTIALPTKTTNGSGVGSFVSSMTGLSPGTLYYVRSYATNTSGTSYGSQVTFTTLSQPVVTTTPITFITSSTSSSGGNVTSDGGSAVTARGVCWSTSINPTIALSTKTSNGTGTGTFGSSITGLAANTLYYVRAYATNAIGTSYGQQVTFTTLTASTTPTVTTTAISAITSTTATGGGNVTSDGGSAVTARGVCWSTSVTPTVALSTKTLNGTGTGSFTSSITGLTPNTTYYVRPYATNANGTSYGSQFPFTTLSNLPTLSTTSASSITSTTAISGGNITSDGGSAVTARGVCWSTSVNPTISDLITNDGTGTGSYASSITGLSSSTTYYVRAYATNTSGTTYGSQVSFTTTQSLSTPIVTTTNISSLTSSTASSGGNVTSDGGSAVTARGVCWSTSENPTISNSITTNGTGTGSYTSSITGLNPNTTYYVRAYATNTSGTSYGGQVSFTTSIDLPTVTTSPISSITINSAFSGGNVTNVGGGFVVAKGVCWSTSPSPTISNSVTIDGDGIGSYTSSILGLSSGTTYYVRAYATNEAGTSYGNQVSFTTTSVGLPVLTTSSVSSITTTTATSGGNVTSDGGSAVTARGVCWSTSQNPTTGSSITSNGTGTGSFTSSIIGLSPATVYYVRSYATNGVGTSYGNQVSFTTSSSTATLTTTSISGLTSTNATSGGNITNSGGSTITSRGVVWSTSPNPTISLNTKTSNGTGTGTFVSSLTSLTASTTYYVRAYATNSAGTVYGNQVTFTTLASSGGGNCLVTNFQVTKVNNKWNFRFNINPNCNNYTVNVCRYSNTNPSVQPTVGQSPVACAVRNNMNNYVPTASEISAGFITREMNPQPANLNQWYSVDVKCNSASCSGSSTTRSSYFYHQ